MMKENPPEYKINWVRVYQDPDNELQKVGCSTPERPTRRFIEAHEKLYKTVDDVSVHCELISCASGGHDLIVPLLWFALCRFNL
jgi:hypothetical protein